MNREESNEQNALTVGLFNKLASGVTDTAAVVEQAYSNLLGLDGNFADAGERKGYWINKLESGDLELDDFAGEFLYQAENVPGKLSEDQFNYNNAAVPAGAAATAATVSDLGYSLETDEDLQELVNSITGEELAQVSESVKAAATTAGTDAAPDANVPSDDDGETDGETDGDTDGDNGGSTGGNSGNVADLSFELTKESGESVMGGAGNDTFTGNAQTTQNEDSIDGKGGNDTLKLNSTGETMPTVKNVENVYFIDNDTTTTDDVGTGQNFDVSDAIDKGFEQIWVQDVDTSGTGIATGGNGPGNGYDGGNVTFGALKDGQVAGLKGRINTAGSDGGDEEGNKDGDDGSVTIGAADGVTAQTVALDGVYGDEPGDETNINMTAAEDLTVDLSGDNAADIDGDSLKNVTFTGNGTIDTELTGDALTVDASATTGGVEVAQSFANEDASFLGGSGDDTLDVDLVDDSGDKAIDMGEGYDTISVQVADSQSGSGNFDKSDGNLTLRPEFNQ